MDTLTRYATQTNAKDLPTSGWLVALGILFLVSTVFYEVAGINLDESIELVERGADLLSIHLKR